MSPALNGSSAIRRFEHSEAIEIRNRITFDFYTGLPLIMQVLSIVSNHLWIVSPTTKSNPIEYKSKIPSEQNMLRWHSFFGEGRLGDCEYKLQEAL